MNESKKTESESEIIAAQGRLGVILMNLGTPTEPTEKAVRAFLKDFLGDPRVVDLPRALWLPILHGFILPFRPKKVAQLYAKIWTPEGSPLRVITQQQVQALQLCLNTQYGELSPVVVSAMTYGDPSLKQQLMALQAQGVDRYLLLPLYPQYSGTTTAAIEDQVQVLNQAAEATFNIQIHRNYYDRADYIDALAASVEKHWREKGRSERLLLSFHGIPQRCVERGDPYYQQCCETAALLAKKLGLASTQYAFSFQSRLGKAKWLEPYTDLLLAQWAQDGVASVDVVCPAFAADCLETLEEIAIQNRELFIAEGGQDYQLIPCLNQNQEHITMMANIVAEYC